MYHMFKSYLLKELNMELQIMLYAFSFRLYEDVDFEAQYWEGD